MDDAGAVDPYSRFLQRHPVGDLSPADLEEWVAEVLTSVGTEQGLSDLVVQTHERIAGGDGAYDLDATVRFRALGLEFLALVEVKHHRNPIKRELVQILHAKVQSVGAHKGVMFATAHFQRGALDYAKAHGIALVFVTEGRLTIERRSSEALEPIPRTTAAEWGIAPIAGTFYGPGADGSTACVYIGPDRPDLVRRCLLDVTDSLEQVRMPLSPTDGDLQG